MDTQLAVYDKWHHSMVLAIDRCYEAPEIKELRDKAMAFETYARQAQNVEAERKAIEVRIRAERRAGQLLKDMEKSHGGRPAENSLHGENSFSEPVKSEYASALEEGKISNNQAARWQKLAEIPHETFEGKLQNPLVRPTTNGLLNGDQPKQAPDDALWLWSRLRDIERDYIFQKDINSVVGEMSEALQSDVRRIVPLLQDWLGELRY